MLDFAGDLVYYWDVETGRWGFFILPSNPQSEYFGRNAPAITWEKSHARLDNGVMAGALRLRGGKK